MNKGFYSSISVLSLVAGSFFSTSAAPLATTIDFEQDQPGKLTNDWTISGTNQKGPTASWSIVFDPSESSHKKYIALTKVNHDSDATFNLAWNVKTKFHNGEIEVAFKALDGRVDQGGGIVWRLQDADNYYLARFNPLEDNFRIYTVINGQRKVLASERATLDKDKWHTLTVRHNEDKIVGLLNGRKLLDLTNASIKESGSVGVWTKADARTAFDDLRINPLP